MQQKELPNNSCEPENFLAQISIPFDRNQRTGGVPVDALRKAEYGRSRSEEPSVQRR